MLPKQCISACAIIKVLSVICCLVIEHNHAFNLSPHPHIVLREPADMKTFMPKMRSSYFGYSINLKKDRWVSRIESIVVDTMRICCWTHRVRSLSVVWIIFVLIIQNPTHIINIYDRDPRFRSAHFCFFSSEYQIIAFNTGFLVEYISHSYNGYSKLIRMGSEWMEHILIRLSKYYNHLSLRSPFIAAFHCVMLFFIIAL